MSDRPAKPNKPAPAAEQLEFFDVGSGELIRTQAVEMAPGVHVILEPELVPADKFPKFGTCEFVRKPDNTFVAIARTHGQLMKLTKGIGRELGCKDKDSKAMYTFIKRCVWAGFITAVNQPDACYLDLHSLFAFLRRVRNPGFWTPARRDLYNKARYGVADRERPEEGDYSPQLLTD